MTEKKEEKDVKKAPLKQELEIEATVTVKASEEPGMVTGIAFEDIEGEGLRWTYRVNNGWYTRDQLET